MWTPPCTITTLLRPPPLPSPFPPFCMHAVVSPVREQYSLNADRHRQPILTLLETLNGEAAKRHFLLIYVAIVLGTCVTLFDYTNMWESRGVCDTAHPSCMQELSATDTTPDTYTDDTLLHDNLTAVVWTGDISELHWLNRFMHLSISIPSYDSWVIHSLEDTIFANDSVLPLNVSDLHDEKILFTRHSERRAFEEAVQDLSYGIVRLTQTVVTDQDEVALSHTRIIDLSGCRVTRECITPPIRIMASGLKRKKIIVKVSQLTRTYQFDGHERFLDEVAINNTIPLTSPITDNMVLTLEFQTGVYTAVDLSVRLTLLAIASYVFFWYRRRLEAIRNARGAIDPPPEVRWVPWLLLSLVAYLNPIAFLSTILRVSTSLTLLENVLEFIEFHAATFFTILIQYMYITIVMGMRGEQIDPTPPDSFFSACVVCFRTHFWRIWVAAMVTCDLLVAVVYKGPSSDYTSTYVGWVLNTQVQHLSVFLGFLYIFGLFLTFLWFFWAIIETQRVKQWLRKVPYGPSRRQQLTFRSLVFMVWTYALSRMVCQILYWSVIGKYQMVYKSADETGTILLCSVFTFATVYQFAPANPRTEEMPPLPGEPCWEHPRWRRCRWPDSWYTWLVEHGSTLYYFVEESEQHAFDALQRAVPEQLLLVSCTSEAGWPTRVSPCHSSEIFGYVLPHSEVKAIPYKGAHGHGTTSPSLNDAEALEDQRAHHLNASSSTSSSSSSSIRHGWYQLLDGTFLSTTDPGCAGRWVSPENIGFGLDFGAQLRENKRAGGWGSGLLNWGSGGAYGLVRADGGAKRLFFCAETASICADLSYAVYYQPGEEDFNQAIQSPNSFGWSLTRQYCAYFSVSLAGAAAAIATGLTHAPPPMLFETQDDDDKLAGTFRSSKGSLTDLDPEAERPNSPWITTDQEKLRREALKRNTTPTPESDPLLNPPKTDLQALGVRLYDVIELAGTRVFIGIDTKRNRVYISFRGSDNRFSKFNLVSDLRFTRQVYDAMGEAANWGSQHLRFGCCAQPLLHRGFMDMWEKPGGGHNIRGPLQQLPLRDVVLGTVDRVLQEFPGNVSPHFYVTGHSLGGALACLCAYSLKKRRGIEAVAYTFGVPKLGNRAFKRAYDHTVPNTFCLVYEYDPVYVFGFLYFLR